MAGDKTTDDRRAEEAEGAEARLTIATVRRRGKRRKATEKFGERRKAGLSSTNVREE